MPCYIVSSMFKFLSKLVLLCAVCLTANAVAEDREWLPLNKLTEILYLDKFYAAPLAQRDKVLARAVLQPQNKAIKPSDVVLTIAYASGKERITLGADGSFELNPSAKAKAENPMVWTNIPKGEKAGLGINMYAAIPSQSTQFSYEALMGGVPQANALIKSQAGMLSLFVPKLTGVLVRFTKTGPQTLSIATKAGTKILTTDEKGQIALKLDEAFMGENPQVTTSAPVLEAEIDALK